jgi:hypothetical protein
MAGSGCKRECDAPSQPTYSCDALPPGSEGCPGVDDSAADKVYPEGCQVTQTWCNAFYGNAPEVCGCTLIGGRTDGGKHYQFSCGL